MLEKTAQKTWKGWGRLALPTGAAVRCLVVENGWRAGPRSLLPRRPRGSIREQRWGREEAAFVLGASQPRCQQGPLPLPLASDTVWQKQCYSRKRGVPPSADRQQKFSNLPLHCWAPARHGQAPFHGLGSIQVSQSGFEQEVKKEERRQRRHLAGSGSPSAEGWGCRT